MALDATGYIGQDLSLKCLSLFQAYAQKNAVVFPPVLFLHDHLELACFIHTVWIVLMHSH